MKVSDFGLATFINDETADVNGGRAAVQRTAKKGTEQYMSPEQVNYTVFQQTENTRTS